MANALVLDMPVELGLGLVPVIGSECLDPVRELVDDAVDEFDRIGLRMALMDFRGTDSGCVIDGCVLEALGLLVSQTA